MKILSGEVALHTSVLKRLTEEAGRSPNNEKIQVLYTLPDIQFRMLLKAFHLETLSSLHMKMEMKKVNDEIKGKKHQIASLERQIPHSISNNQGMADKLELTPVTSCIRFSSCCFVPSILLNNLMVLLLVFQSYAELLEQLNEKSFDLEVLKKFVHFAVFHVYCTRVY